MQLRRLHVTRCADGKATERAELRDNSRSFERAPRKDHENLVRKCHLPLLSRSLDRVSSGRASRPGEATRRRLLYCPALRTRLLPGLRRRLHIRSRTVLHARPSAQVVSQIPSRSRRSCTLSASAMTLASICGRIRDGRSRRVDAFKVKGICVSVPAIISLQVCNSIL
jgi:hypothetical protein